MLADEPQRAPRIRSANPLLALPRHATAEETKTRTTTKRHLRLSLWHVPTVAIGPDAF